MSLVSFFWDTVYMHLVLLIGIRQLRVCYVFLHELLLDQERI